MNPVSNYLAMRNTGFGHKVSADTAGLTLPWLVRTAKAVCFWLALLVCVLYLLSDQANALEADSKQAVIAKQAAYIQALEKIVSLCFGDKEQPVLVGNEWHMCRAVPTGITQ